MRAVIYKNSPLATLFNLIGALLVLAGIGVFFAGVHVAIPAAMLVVGALMVLVSPKVHVASSANRWWKTVTKTLPENVIAKDGQLIARVYNESPYKKQTLKRLRKLNPEEAGKLK